MVSRFVGVERKQVSSLSNSFDSARTKILGEGEDFDALRAGGKSLLGQFRESLRGPGSGSSSSRLVPRVASSGLADQPSFFEPLNSVGRAVGKEVPWGEGHTVRPLPRLWG